MIGRLVLWGGDPYIDVQFGSREAALRRAWDEIKALAGVSA